MSEENDNRITYRRYAPSSKDEIVLRCSKCGEDFAVDSVDITTITNERTGEFEHKFNKSPALCNPCRDMHPEMQIEIDIPF